MAREAFKPAQLTPADRGKLVQLPPSADDLPERVVVDLDGKDGNNYEIVVTDDTPEKDRGKDTTWNGPSAADEEELRGISGKVQKRIDRLRAETETERRAREAANRERDAAIELTRSQQAEIERLRAAQEASNRTTASAMITERETRINEAKRRLEQAHADGDNSAIATATSDLSQAQAELVAIRARAPAPKPEGQQRQAAAPAPAAPAPANVAPRTQQFLEHNRSWWNKDKAKTDKALSLHYELASEGITPSSVEYIREVDKRLRAVYPDHQPMETIPDDGDGGNPRPRRTNTVEQGGREERVGAPANPRKVELTQSEVSLANRLRIPLAKYAEEKQRRLANEGGAR